MWYLLLFGAFVALIVFFIWGEDPSAEKKEMEFAGSEVNELLNELGAICEGLKTAPLWHRIKSFPGRLMLGKLDSHTVAAKLRAARKLADIKGQADFEELKVSLPKADILDLISNMYMLKFMAQKAIKLGANLDAVKYDAADKLYKQVIKSYKGQWYHIDTED